MASLPKSPPGRNEPCWCGSSLKYKHCHSEIDTARGKSRVDVAKRVYLRGFPVQRLADATTRPLKFWTHVSA